MALLFCGQLRPPLAEREATVTTSNSAFRIAVLPGDGIGVEVTEACLAVLDVLRRKVGGFALDAETLPAGAAHYRATGIALPDESMAAAKAAVIAPLARRSEEHTSELQSLMRISYAVFCLKKTKRNTQQ